jgi:sporulation protein YlmC with PRC-barrel domain
MSHRSSLIAIVLMLLWSSPNAGAEPGKVDLEAAEMVAELIGAPVLALDGTEVGVVTDIAFDEELRPESLRMSTGAILGLGTRILQVPKEAFMPVRGAVILRVKADDVGSFREAGPPRGTR